MPKETFLEIVSRPFMAFYALILIGFLMITAPVNKESLMTPWERASFALILWGIPIAPAFVFRPMAGLAALVLEVAVLNAITWWSLKYRLRFG